MRSVLAFILLISLGLAFAAPPAPGYTFVNVAQFGDLVLLAENGTVNISLPSQSLSIPQVFAPGVHTVWVQNASMATIYAFNLTAVENASTNVAIMGSNSTGLAVALVENPPAPAETDLVNGRILVVNALSSSANVIVGGQSQSIASGENYPFTVSSGLVTVSLGNASNTLLSFWLSSRTDLAIYLSGDSTAPWSLVQDLASYPVTFSYRFVNFASAPSSVDLWINGVSAGHFNQAVVGTYQSAQTGVLNITVIDFATHTVVLQDYSTTISNNSVNFTVALAGDSTVTGNSSLGLQIFTYEDVFTTPSYPSAGSVRAFNFIQSTADVSFAAIAINPTTGFQVAGPNLAFGESATIDVPVLEGGYLITLAVPNSNITVAQMLQVPQYEVFSFFALASTATPTNLAKVVREISFPTPPPASHLRAAHWVEDVDDDVELVVQGGAIFRNLTKADVTSYSNYTWNGTNTLEVTLQLRDSKTAAVLAQLPFNLTNLFNYTVVASGVNGANSSYPVQLFVLGDVLLAPSDRAIARYVNVVPANMTLSILASGLPNPADWSSLGYGKSSLYQVFPGTSTSVHLNNQSNDTLDDSQFSFKNGTSYTIWANGDAANGDPQLTITQDYPAAKSTTGLTALELGLIIGGAILFAILLLAIVVFVVRSNRSDGYETISN